MRLEAALPAGLRSQLGELRRDALEELGWGDMRHESESQAGRSCGWNTLLLPAFLLLVVSCRSSPEVPVLVGEIEGLDACLSIGTARAPEGMEYFEIRSGPGEGFRVLNRLHPGHVLYLCGGSADELWAGVVYGEDPSSYPDCGVTSPVPQAQPYSGPCKSGWVKSELVEVIAG